MRSLRELVSGGTYHVTARINNKEHHIRRNLCKEMVLEILAKLQKEMGFKIEHFSLMNNHIHLIITTLDFELPKIMQRLLMTYAIRYNKRYNRTGHVWGDRYYSRILWTQEAVRKCFEYLNENPVKAKIAKTSLDWIWNGLTYYVIHFTTMNNWISDWSHALYMEFRGSPN